MNWARSGGNGPKTVLPIVASVFGAETTLLTACPVLLNAFTSPIVVLSANY